MTKYSIMIKIDIEKKKQDLMTKMESNILTEQKLFKEMYFNNFYLGIKEYIESYVLEL